MNTRVSAIIAVLVAVFCCNGFAQEKAVLPAIFWENGANKGVILVSLTEMWIVDSKGDRQGKVLVDEVVDGVYMSPDGKKLIYTTMTGVWLLKIGSGEKYLVLKGYCDYLRWNVDGSSFIFSLGTKVKDEISNVKVFWADGEGKNIKQAYP